MKPIKDYRDYKRREFCKDIMCAIQLDLDAQAEDSKEYEQIRQICKDRCKYTTYQFHHWLIEKGFMIIKPETK